MWKLHATPSSRYKLIKIWTRCKALEHAFEILVPRAKRQLSATEKSAAGAMKSRAQSWAQVQAGSPCPGRGEACPDRGLWMVVISGMELKTHWDRDTTARLGSI